MGIAIRTGLLALASFTVACGGSHAEPQPSVQPEGRLSGNVDVRPFTAVEAYAYRRPDNSKADIKAFPFAVGPEAGCQAGELMLEETQRMVLVQMPWPVDEGSEWNTETRQDNDRYVGIFFHVRRGLGGSSQRAEGILRATSVADDRGELWLHVATANKAGGVHGSLEGSLPFTVCP